MTNFKDLQSNQEVSKDEYHLDQSIYLSFFTLQLGF